MLWGCILQVWLLLVVVVVVVVNLCGNGQDFEIFWKFVCSSIEY